MKHKFPEMISQLGVGSISDFPIEFQQKNKIQNMKDRMDHLLYDSPKNKNKNRSLTPIV